MRTGFTYLLLVFGMLMLVRCEPEEDRTPNPYTNNDDGTEVPDTVDPATIQGLHRYIFSVKCANPTCHDGSFEPDFRTVESTYQTLVYHPVIKNTDDRRFEYRVVPNDHEASWLYERLTTTDEVIGRMPLYAEPLSARELGWVIDWIEDGARNSDGIPAIYPNQLPSVEGFILVDDQNVRVDTMRMNGQVSPMALPDNELLTLYVVVEDDSTALADLQVNTGKFSYDEYDFSNAVSKTAVPVAGVAYQLQFNTNEFTPGDTVWFRYYVKDTDNPETVEFPDDDSPFYFRIIASFVVQ